MITATNLSKRFGDLIAVNNIDLDIRSGEVIGLLGPNGAGKTTTISMLIGLLKPDSGKIVLGKNGSPFNAADRRQIGIAPQKLSLYDELSGRENLSFFAQMYGLTGLKAKDRVAWALDFAGLADRASEYVRNYSGGMQRRLNLASALVHQPKVLLLDEPTVGVDPQSRNHLLECIEQLKSDGLTILYTTHYMEEAQRLCDRVAIMDHGSILTVDTTQQLLSEYGGNSVITANLVESPKHEFDFPVKIDGDQLRFESSDPIQEIAVLHKQGVTFSTLEIKQPDLESVFLKLTGRSLRD